MNDVVAARFVCQTLLEKWMVYKGVRKTDDTNMSSEQRCDRFIGDRKRSVGWVGLKGRERRKRFFELDVELGPLAAIQERTVHVRDDRQETIQGGPGRHISVLTHCTGQGLEKNWIHPSRTSQPCQNGGQVLGERGGIARKLFAGASRAASQFALAKDLSQNDDVAAGQLAVFQGGPRRTGGKAPISGFILILIRTKRPCVRT